MKKAVLHGLAGTLLLATASLGSISVSTPVFAAESYDNCVGFIDALPATIKTQGVWCLRKDLSTAITSGQALTVATNNVTIDCNNFKVGGLAAGNGTQAWGIFANERLNITVRNCNVRGFNHGIHLEAGSGHLVENNLLDGNTFVGMYVSRSGDSTIRGNRVIGTGGSGLPFVSIYGMFVEGADIIDNTVSGVAGDRTQSYGIYTVLNGQYSIIGNRVRGVISYNSGGVAYGIANYNAAGIIVRDNNMQGAGAANSIGMTCQGGDPNLGKTAYNNLITGFATEVQGCVEPPR